MRQDTRRYAPSWRRCAPRGCKQTLCVRALYAGPGQSLCAKTRDAMPRQGALCTRTQDAMRQNKGNRRSVPGERAVCTSLPDGAWPCLYLACCFCSLCLPGRLAAADVTLVPRDVQKSSTPNSTTYSLCNNIKKNIYTYSYVNTYIHVYIYVCISTYMYTYLLFTPNTSPT